MATVLKDKEIKEKYYTILKPVGENDKCPPQAKTIVETLTAAEGSRMERDELITILKDGRIKTNQTVERIFGFYRPRLIQMGVMKEEVVSRTIQVEVEVPDEPAKTDAPAGDGAAADAPAGEAKPDKVKGKKGAPKTEAASE